MAGPAKNPGQQVDTFITAARNQYISHGHRTAAPVGHAVRRAGVPDSDSAQPCSSGRAEGDSLAFSRTPLPALLCAPKSRVSWPRSRAGPDSRCPSAFPRCSAGLGRPCGGHPDLPLRPALRPWARRFPALPAGMLKGHPAHEVTHTQSAVGAGPAIGRQNVVGAGAIIPQRFRRPRADEYRSGMAHTLARVQPHQRY